MVGITPKHSFEQAPGRNSFAQTELGLRLQKQRGGLLSELKIVLKEEHRWERGREVINFGALLLKLATVRQQVAEKAPGFRAPAELFQGKRRIVGHLAERADAHLLKITFELGGGGPMTPSGFDIASGGAGGTEPIIYVALVGQKVSGFAEIAR
jgi:hypothetical protein